MTRDLPTFLTLLAYPPLPNGLQTERGTHNLSNQVKPGAPYSFHIDLVSCQRDLSVRETERKCMRNRERNEGGMNVSRRLNDSVVEWQSVAVCERLGKLRGRGVRESVEGASKENEIKGNFQGLELLRVKNK